MKSIINLILWDADKDSLFIACYVYVQINF